MKKVSPALILITLCAVLISSCKTAPTACFTVETNADSIRVGRPVTFNSGCSTDASQYYWDFGNGQNSYINPTVSMTYDTVGTYNVSLVVSGSGKTASSTKSIIVKP